MAAAITRRDAIALGLAGGTALLGLRSVGSSPAGAALSAPPPGPNLLANASFEDGPPGRAAPGWSFT